MDEDYSLTFNWLSQDITGKDVGGGGGASLYCKRFGVLQPYLICIPVVCMTHGLLTI